MKDHRTYGTTKGLVTEGCSKEHLRAEQVYVRRSGEDTHPIMVEAWVGWDIFGRMKVTKGQALELAHLLIDAVVAP